MPPRPAPTRWAVLVACSACLGSACEQTHSLEPTDSSISVENPVTPVPVIGFAPNAPLPRTTPRPVPTAGAPAFAPVEPPPCSLDGDRDGFRPVGAATHDIVEDECKYTEPGDCNDESVAIDPESPERCNETDDDCDGRIDEDRTCSVMVTTALDTPELAYLTVTSDAAGVVYRYHSETRRLERLGAGEQPVWSAEVPGGSRLVKLAADAREGAVYLAALWEDGRSGLEHTIVARFDNVSGSMVWKRTFEVASSPTNLAIAADGDVYLSGKQTWDLGNYEHRVGLFARLSAADGEVLKLETPLNIDVMGIATAPDGALALVAAYDDANQPASMLGPCKIPGSLSDFAVYVAPDGSCGWVLDGEERGGSAIGPNITHTAFLADGAVVVAGAAYPEFRFGETDLTDARSVVEIEPSLIRKRGGNEAFVVAVDRSAKLRWFQRVPTLGERDELHALRVDTEVIVAIDVAFYEAYWSRYTTATAHALGVLMAFDGLSGEPAWSRDLDRRTPHDNASVTSIARGADGSLRIAVSGDMLIVDSPDLN